MVVSKLILQLHIWSDTTLYFYHLTKIWFKWRFLWCKFLRILQYVFCQSLEQPKQ